jgi:hypothetical protein
MITMANPRGLALILVAIVATAETRNLEPKYNNTAAVKTWAVTVIL